MNTVFNIAIVASVFHLTHNNNNKKPICVTHSAWHEHEKEGVAFKTFSVELCVLVSLFFFFFFFIYFIYGCVGSSFLCEGSLQLWQAGATLHRGVRASRYRGLSCCGAQAPDAQAQQLWLPGPAAPRHVGSSQTRARTRVPCIGRRILNHCATREALVSLFYTQSINMPWWPLSYTNNLDLTT